MPALIVPISPAEVIFPVRERDRKELAPSIMGARGRWGGGQEELANRASFQKREVLAKQSKFNQSWPENFSKSEF